MLFRRYIAIALIPALTGVLVMLWLWPDAPAWPQGEPPEGYYWSPSQVQLAFFRFHAELRLIAAGQPADPEVVPLRAAVLASKIDRLTEPSEIRNGLEGIPGYTETTARLAEFNNAAVRPFYMAPPSAADAQRVLVRFGEIEATLADLVNSARAEEIAGRDQVQHELVGRRFTYLSLALLLTLAVGAWLLAMRVSYRKIRTLAAQRLDALEAQTRVKAELERVLQEKRHFFSMVSHELRSPLQAILSSVDLMDSSASRHEQEQALQRTRRSALALCTQLRDLLSIAGESKGVLEIRPEEFEARALVEGVADIFAELAEAKGLRFVLKLPPDPIFANADAERLTQILRNLVSNAVRYTARGSVRLELEAVDRPGDTRLVLHVADTGPGLPSAYVENIRRNLDPGSVRPREDGTGIGLAIAGLVARRLGGTIDVRTQPGGTHFTIGIPVSVADPDSPWPKGEMPSPQHLAATAGCRAMTAQFR